MKSSGETVAAWLSAAPLALCATTAYADTRAGTPIDNVAQLSYDAAAGRVTASSNTAQVIVAERLDVVLTAGTVVATGDRTVVAVILTNTGNGDESFAVAATAAAGASAITAIGADTDGDGQYDPTRDRVLADGRTAVLAPGQSVTLFVIVAKGTTGTVTVTAAAATGSGAPGTGFPGMGDGGGDAVTGTTGARASVTIPLAAAAGDAPTLAKSAAVSAPDGSSRAVRGATITYTLVARFPGATAAPAVTDPIPAGTAYVPASLTLDDTRLSDPADADAGDATATGIRVALGDQPAGTIRTIRFKVVIQ